ncbi:MAG TPA: hypothetical protein VFE62_29625 [Gemmataceae bacterium]|nr:hypothetical protein [Gemmataceae bacterium]
MIVLCPNCRASFSIPDEADAEGEVCCPDCAQVYCPSKEQKDREIPLIQYAKRVGLVPSTAMRLSALLILVALAHRGAEYYSARSQILDEYAQMDREPAIINLERRLLDNLNASLGVLALLYIILALILAAAGRAIRNVGSHGNFTDGIVRCSLVLCIALTGWSVLQVVRYAVLWSLGENLPQNVQSFWTDVGFDMVGCFIFPVATLGAFRYVQIRKAVETYGERSSQGR